MGSSAEYRGPPVDIWSAGVILYIMTAGAFPFTQATNRCELFMSLLQGNFKFPEKMSPELKDLLVKMWTVDPEQRITIPQIKQHPWFNLNSALPEPHALSVMDDVYDDPLFEDTGMYDVNMLNHDEMDFERYEEPVYRSMEEHGGAPVLPSPVSEKAVATSLSLCSVKPTAQFVCQSPQSELVTKLSEWFMAHGASSVQEEDSQLEVDLGQTEATALPLQVVFRMEGMEDGGTKISVRRSKGPCLQYIEAYNTLIRPGVDACLA